MQESHLASEMCTSEQKVLPGVGSLVPFQKKNNKIICKFFKKHVHVVNTVKAQEGTSKAQEGI